MKRAIHHASFACRRQRGSVLIIVMWICLGLVALALYFANSMSSELRAAENRSSDIAARQAVAAGTRYAAYLLTQHVSGGKVPRREDIRAEGLPVGEAMFWFVGRDNDETRSMPAHGIIDECSKLNLNTVTAAMLRNLPLPDMTPEFAAAIVAWRTTGQAGLAADSIYTSMNPPRHNKSAPYESIDELRLVDGATLDLLFGEDTNRNGILDPNEDDGEESAPRDDRNGQLLPGLLECVTLYSSEPANSPSGTRRLNVRTLTRAQLRNLLGQRGFQTLRTEEIVLRVPQQQGQQNPNQVVFQSVADFMLTSQMTAEEFALVHADFTATTATNGISTGLVNVNTASEAVLAAIPGIGPDRAATVVAYRRGQTAELTSFHWLTQVLTPAQIRQAGPFITAQSYQFSVDIVGVGANGRGFCREKVVFDMSTGTPRIVYRQDLTAYGWPLGVEVRRSLLENRIY